MHEDTVSLLGDCMAGMEMALFSLEELLPRVESRTMREKLRDSVGTHQVLQARARTLLQQAGGREADPGTAARAMARMKLRSTMALHPEDAAAAELVAQGCDRGVRSLSRSRNRWGGAEPGAIALAQELIRTEERLSAGMRPYL